MMGERGNKRKNTIGVSTGEVPPESAQTLTNNAERLPPQSIESERHVLGGVLFDNASLDKVADFLIPEDFYRATHQIIFRAMLALYSRHEAIDTVTLTEYLKASGELETIGGTPFLIDLLSDISSAANIVYHGRIVHRHATYRRLISISTDVASKCYSAPVELEEFLDDIEARIFEVGRAKSEAGYAHVGSLITESIEYIGQLMNKPGKLTGIPSGFIDIDNTTNGWQRGNLIILGARPGAGKTSLALNMAVNAARIENSTVFIFSLEMSKREVALRILSSAAEVPSQHIRSPHNMTDKDFDNLLEASQGQLPKLKIFIDDTPAISVTELRSKARRLKAEHGLDMLIVDYLQLMRTNLRYDNRTQEITDISRSLKALAKELDIPIIALSQLSRETERRKEDDRRPRLADLRESGSIEQDADVVAFLYSKYYYDMQKNPEEAMTEEKQDGYEIELIIAKHRNGPVRSMKLLFRQNVTRFENVAAEAGNEEPF